MGDAKTAVVFAGQGAQGIGMGAELAVAYPECRALFDRAGEILGYDLGALCFKGPESELIRSDRCQPAVFVVGAAACAALMKEKPGFAAEGMAGLSLGEWTALYAAGAVSFDDALRILEARGRFMQEACREHEGAMTSVIGLTPESLKPVCASAGVEMANLNSPEQTVLSGPKKGIEAAEQLAAQAGAKKVIRLNVAGAFHSSLMASAAGRLAEVLAKVPIQTPRVPVISNVTGQPHGAPDAIRQTMVKQVTSSVQWIACIQWFQSRGVTRYVECGPGRVLSGLIKRTAAASVQCNVQDKASLQKALTALG
ncbi:MAG: ACP S-malonyltransferase [Lentisphaerae bacterium]|nr:ACP S-malonyltransferase [Lentisphaerota bacterium]